MANKITVHNEILSIFLLIEHKGDNKREESSKNNISLNYMIVNVALSMYYIGSDCIVLIKLIFPTWNYNYGPECYYKQGIQFTVDHEFIYWTLS